MVIFHRLNQYSLKTRTILQENWSNQSNVHVCEMNWIHGPRNRSKSIQQLSKWKVTQPHHRWRAMRQALQTNIGVCLPQAPNKAKLTNKLTNHSCDDSWIYESLLTFEDRLWITHRSERFFIPVRQHLTPGGKRKLTISHYAVDTTTGSKVRCGQLGSLVTYWHVSKTHHGQSIHGTPLTPPSQASSNINKAIQICQTVAQWHNTLTESHSNDDHQDQYNPGSEEKT